MHAECMSTKVAICKPCCQHTSIYPVAHILGVNIYYSI